MDQRKEMLALWARQCLQELAGSKPVAGRVETVSGDASFRRYFRLRLEIAPGCRDAGSDKVLDEPLRELLGNNSFVLVDAPPAHEDCQRFVSIAAQFRAAGMLTPRVLSVDYDQGFMLLEDFGDDLYLAALRSITDAQILYTVAMKALIELQANAAPIDLPMFDRKLLRMELSLFEHWFCERFLELALDQEERDLLHRTWTFLEDAALAQTQVCVHRDFHSRNLMVLNNNPWHAPGVIDFQDAVIGACTYDLVSLLRDCYIVWPQQDVRRWALQYRELAQERGIVAGSGPQAEKAFLRDFDLMGLQRHIKVIGIFCRLNFRDAKPRYMTDVPVVINYVLQAASQHPEMGPFLTWFSRRALPVAEPRLQAYMYAGSLA